MSMDEMALEIQAMLVRAEAARQLIGKEDGLYLLAMIVLPNEKVERASRMVAEQTGPSLLARKMAAERASRAERRERDAAPLPRRPLARPAKRRAPARFVSLDEILAMA